jgi:prepilin-type N-terminal cleavage/methylation domain-containing protein
MKSLQRGLTMIELLATMVLMSMIMVLMSGALSQVSQVLRVSDAAQAGFLPKWRSERLLGEVVSQWVIDPQRSFEAGLKKLEFVGEPELAKFNSFSLPWVIDGQSGSALLEVQRNADSSTLWLKPWAQVLDTSPRAGSETPALELGKWPVPVVLRYVDELGQEFAQWPPNGVSQTRALPAGLRVRQADGAQPVLLGFSYEGHGDPVERNSLAGFFSGGGQ